MAQGYDTEEQKERVLLVGVQLDNQEDMESSLEELKALAKTAGAETVGKVIQPRDAYHPATYIGKGKLEEVRSLIEETGATGIICDDELSPAQLRNLEDALGTKVMDRTMVILDIFASRATTSEGKIQVEVATVKVPLHQTDRTWNNAFKTGWRYRYERTGRKEARNRQTNYP